MTYSTHKQLLIGLSLASFFLVLPPSALAQVSKQVQATVAVSVCGNGVIESGEECEGSNLNGATCLSRGYTSGVLLCDVACSWDSGLCDPASPRASALPITLRQGSFLRPLIIPATVQYFDTDNTGTIELPELYKVVARWVAFWQQETQSAGSARACDVNRDSVCDIQDLSILLSYVEH